MTNDNDTPFAKLDIEALFNMREWISDAVTAKGGKVTGAGIGVGGELGEADLDVELDGCRFNLAIRPRPR